MDEIKRKLFEYCKAFIQEIIENRECDIRLLYDAKKNVDLMMAFYRSGISDRYDVLEATWNVASKHEPDDIRNDSTKKWGQTPIFYGMIRHLNCWAVMRCQEAQELFSWGLLIM